MQFRNLSYSRDHETEADRMGLVFAAMAGYDPNVAVSFWQRMSANSNNNTSEFFSDHPSDATRIKQIQGWMPEALRYYQGGQTTSTFNITSQGVKQQKNTKKAMREIHIK